MNTLNDQANSEDFDTLRKAVAMQCVKLCYNIEQARWAQYKGRTADKSLQGNPHTEGMSDGATECAAAISEAFGLEQ